MEMHEVMAKLRKRATELREHMNKLRTATREVCAAHGVEFKAGNVRLIHSTPRSAEVITPAGVIRVTV